MYKLRIFFLLSVIGLVFTPLFFPSIRLFAFAPFLALVFLRKEWIKSLWIAAQAGLIVDMLNTSLPFGLHALSYTILGAVCYLYRRYFFEGYLFSISFYTIFLSLYLAPIQFIFLYFFGHPFSFSLTDLILMPLLDGVYAFFWFTCPFLLYNVKYGFHRPR